MNIQSKANTAELKASYGHTFTEQLLQVRMLKLVTIPYQTMKQKPRVQEGMVQMSWNCSKPRKLGSKRGSAAWKISLLATTQPKPRSVGLHVIFPNLSQICHKI